MEIKRPLLLISNDDGFQAKGINCLVEMLKDIADIIVCAPDDARSGYSRAFSAGIPLRLDLRHQEEGVEVWSCNGTPVDCVKMALANICQRRPDMVIGGINHGDNASVNAHYSGTMGVTIEGCLKYIPSLAFSLCDYAPDADFEPLRPYVRQITQRVLAEGLPKGVCLNVNFPSQASMPSMASMASPASSASSASSASDASSASIPPYRGVKVCRMAFGTWYNETIKEHHPRGYDYWWMVGHYRNDEPEAEDTDNWALSHGYVAITPTTIDVTAYQAIDLINSWNL